MTIARRILLALFALPGIFSAPLLLPGSVTPEAAASWQPAPLAIEARQRNLHSVSTNREYRILVAIPRTPPPPSGHPILYILDGQQTFPIAALITQISASPSSAPGPPAGIIVGIVHIPAGNDKNPRSEDFTPRAPDFSNTGEPSDKNPGGADRFLDFLENELKPLLAAEFPIDRNRQTLFGHSYGGLLVLHTLFTRPETFQRYFAASPSIWWNNRFILSERDTFIKTRLPGLKKNDAVPPLAISVGDGEQTPLPHHNKLGRAGMVTARRMVDNARELAASLDESGLKPRLHVFENENHGMARVSAINQAIRMAFGE